MFPKIRFVDEIPQWIMSSDTAAYSPKMNQIWVRRDRWWMIIHELIHWVAHLTGGTECRIHKWVDHGRINFR